MASYKTRATIGRGFFDFKRKIAETKERRQQQEAEAKEEIETFNELSLDLSVKKKELISAGKQILEAEVNKFAQFFNSMDLDEVNDFNLDVPDQFDFIKPFSQLSKNFENQLNKVNHYESLKASNDFEPDVKTKINQQFRQEKRNNKKEHEITIHNKVIEKDNDEIKINFDDIKQNHLSNQQAINNNKPFKGLAQWRKYQLWLDLEYERALDEYNNLTDDEFNLRIALLELNKYEDENCKQFYRSSRTLIVYIPSGGSKTTLYNRFKKFFFDIDKLLWYDDSFDKFHFIKNYVVETGEWHLLNNFWQELVAKYHKVFKDRILLAHSPHQIPVNLRKQCEELILLPKDGNNPRDFNTNYQELIKHKDIYKVSAYKSVFPYFIFNYAYHCNLFRQFEDPYLSKLDMLRKENYESDDSYNSVFSSTFD